MTIPFWAFVIFAIVVIVLAVKGLLGKVIANLIFAAAFIALAWFVILPALHSMRSVKGIAEENIHATSLSSADDAFKSARRGAFPDSGRLATHDRYMAQLAKLGFTLDESERRAEAILNGANFGEFTLDPQHPVRPDPQSWVQPFRELADGSKVPLEVCAPYAIITVLGTVKASRFDAALDVETGATGWSVDKPDPWRNFQTVQPDAPFMALLVRQGINGTPRWDWVPVGEGKYQIVLKRESGCAPLYYAFNNLMIEPGGDVWASSFTDSVGQMTGWMSQGR